MQPPDLISSAPPFDERERRLWWWQPLLAGATYGLLMRISFGVMDRFSGPSQSATGVMLMSFVLLVPFLVGAISVYFLPKEGRTVGRSLLVSLVSVALFIASTGILLIEGLICIAMASPIFLAIGCLGGLAMHFGMRWYAVSRSSMSVMALLPFALASVERHSTPPSHLGAAQASVMINASPAQVWQLINNAQAIAPEEMNQGLAYKIGVPLPKSALTVDTPNGRVRKLVWDKGVRFDEPIFAWQPEQFIRWRYDFAADSIPADALDEHVQLGGRYFDLIDTAYKLTPENGGTKLSIEVNYRISTAFNFYAAPLGSILVDDAAQTILSFYKRRAELAHR
jgi:hypothetical protein